jgi:hypothetical protein
MSTNKKIGLPAGNTIPMSIHGALHRIDPQRPEKPAGPTNDWQHPMIDAIGKCRDVFSILSPPGSQLGPLPLFRASRVRR